MSSHSPSKRRSSRHPVVFWVAMSSLGLLYLVLIVVMVSANFQFVGGDDIQALLADPNVRYSTALSLITSTIAAILATWVAVPTGYVLARLGPDAIEQHYSDRPILKRLLISLRHLIDSILDMPIFLPPLVVGISLLVLFQSSLGQWLDRSTADFFNWCQYPGLGGITYEIPAVILAQFCVGTAFAIRTMRDSFEQMDARPEQIASTLGASRFQTFWWVALPQARRSVIAAFTLAWARSLGEFGPVLVFAGTARMKTEVLPTTIYLNFQMGNLKGAAAASLILVTLAILVLAITRWTTLGGKS